MFLLISSAPHSRTIARGAPIIIESFKISIEFPNPSLDVWSFDLKVCFNIHDPPS